MPAGRYFIEGVFLTPASSITYSSDSYACPSYIATYPDLSQVFQACSNSNLVTEEDNSTRTRNIALIVVFSTLGVAALVILIVCLAKKSAASGAAAPSPPEGNDSGTIAV